MAVGRWLVVLAILVGLPTRASAEWQLWDSPNGGTEVLELVQEAWNGVRSPVATNGVGQSFVPSSASLYRFDLTVRNRYDTRPVRARMWRWMDLNGNGSAEDSEYAETVAHAPLWEDTFSIPGPNDDARLTLFPRLAVVPGVPYYVELNSTTGDGEFGVLVQDGAGDAYAGGALRYGGRFYYVPAASTYTDMAFGIYAAPQGTPAPRSCADGSPAPCSSTPAPWDLPGPSVPELTPQIFYDLIENKIERNRLVHLTNDGRTAHLFALYDAFLYRVTHDEWHAAQTVALLAKSHEYRTGQPDGKVLFPWLEHPAQAYAWIRDSPTLTAADHVMIKQLLLHEAISVWEGRELGSWNHAFAKALGLKWVTDLIPPSEFPALSACRPGPSPACVGFFDENEQLDANDHAAWKAFADQVWSEFLVDLDFQEDASRYHYLCMQWVLELAKLYDEDALWQSEGFRKLVERLAAQILPMGAYPVLGDTRGWNMSWVTPIWLFEAAAVRWHDPTYRWLAWRIYDYRQSRIKNTLVNGNRVEPWDAIYEEYPSACLVYFDMDASMPVAAPTELAEQVREQQIAESSFPWIVGPAGLAQRIRVDERAVVRIDLKLQRGGSAEPATVRIWRWSSSYAQTVAAQPIYAGRLPMPSVDNPQVVKLYAVLEPGTSEFLLVQVSRDTPLTLFGSRDPGPDAYAGGELWDAGLARPSADLWFRSHVLDDRGSILTRRSLSTPRRPSQYGYPARFHDLHPEQVPDKLIFRSGWDPDDMHAVVNLVTGPYSHGQFEHGALVSLVKDGSVLLRDSTYEDRLEKDHNRLITRRYWGGAHTDQVDPLTVDRFAEYRQASVAWLSWDEPHGFGNEHHRRYVFVKNRFLWVRDRSRFGQAMRATTGTVWHAHDVHPDHGTHWFSLYDREPLGMNGWRFNNPEHHVLLYLADRTGLEIEQGQVEVVGTPPSASYLVTQRWDGDSTAGQEHWFDALLIPHGPGASPSEVAGGVTRLYDDGETVAWRVELEDETWTVVDNPSRRTLALSDLCTDAEYLIARTTPGGSGSLITHRATVVDLSDGPGRRIVGDWDVPSSVEWVDVAAIANGEPGPRPRRCRLQRSGSPEPPPPLPSLRNPVRPRRVAED